MKWFCLEQYIRTQMKWSTNTFGPGDRTAGVIDHIRKELKEVEAEPKDLSEWADIIILALDGAWRNGFTERQITNALLAKQEKNLSRTWPDWRTAEPGKAIEHVREHPDRADSQSPGGSVAPPQHDVDQRDNDEKHLAQFRP